MPAQQCSGQSSLDGDGSTRPSLTFFFFQKEKEVIKRSHQRSFAWSFSSFSLLKRQRMASLTVRMSVLEEPAWCRRSSCQGSGNLCMGLNFSFYMRPQLSLGNDKRPHEREVLEAQQDFLIFSLKEKKEGRERSNDRLQTIDRSLLFSFLKRKWRLAGNQERERASARWPSHFSLLIIKARPICFLGPRAKRAITWPINGRSLSTLGSYLRPRKRSSDLGCHEGLQGPSISCRDTIAGSLPWRQLQAGHLLMARQGRLLLAHKKEERASAEARFIALFFLILCARRRIVGLKKRSAFGWAINAIASSMRPTIAFSSRKCQPPEERKRKKE